MSGQSCLLDFQDNGFLDYVWESDYIKKVNFESDSLNKFGVDTGKPKKTKKKYDLNFESADFKPKRQLTLLEIQGGTN